MSASKYLKTFSPSSVNKFIEDKPGFLMERVLKLPFIPNCTMKRGEAVEKGINEILQGTMEVEQAKEHALALYDANTRDMDIEEAAKYRAHIPAIIDLGATALAKYGKPVALQKRIEFQEGWYGTALPWFGMLDFEFEEFVVDLKVTSKTPSELRPGYARQGSYYWAGTRKPVVFTHLICTETGKLSVKEIEVTNHEAHINVLTRAAKAMDKALKAPADVLQAMWFPDPGAWQNGDAGTQAKISEVWSI